jgi:AcrR family transcriptional regulator
MAVQTRSRTTSRRQIGGSNGLQEQLKGESRAAILKAGHEIFFGKPYLFATTEEIIRAAGVSRATFYTHFETKLALAWAVFENASGEWLSHFDELADIDHQNIPALERWLARLVKLAASHGHISTLFRQLDIIEDEAQRRADEYRDILVERLGKRLKPFAVAAGNSPRAQRARIRAHHLLQHIDHICSQLALRKPHGDPAIHLRLVAEEISTFLKG